MTKFLALTSDLLARITLTLISSFAIAGCFQKFIFKGFNLLARITLTLISSFAITGCFQKFIFKGFNLSILNFEFCILVCVM